MRRGDYCQLIPRPLARPTEQVDEVVTRTHEYAERTKSSTFPARGAEGDTGAFSCIRSDGTNIVNVLDPPAQPWVRASGVPRSSHSTRTRIPILRTRRAWRRYGTSTICATRARTKVTSQDSSGAPQPERVAAAAASTGAVPFTSSGRASSTLPRPTVMVRRSARSRRSERRAVHQQQWVVPDHPGI